MSQVFTLNQNEYGKEMNFQVSDSGGNPINISGSTVRIRFWNGYPGSGSFFDKTCSLINYGTLGQAQYILQNGDLTGSAGQYYGELEVAAPTFHIYIHNYVLQLNESYPSGSS